MIERIRCIPVICPWGMRFYSLHPQCEWCYRKCLKLRQACARNDGSAPKGAPEGFARKDDPEGSDARSEGS